MRVTSNEQNMSPESFAFRGDKKCFCCFPEIFACLLLQILSRASGRDKISEVAKLEDTEPRGHVVRDLSPSLAGP